MIGHELFHGFDYASTTVGRGERVKRWLKNETLKEFDKRVRCMVRQYSGFCYDKENYCISGNRTINDNIADIDGIKITYMAYKFLTQLEKQPRLPGLEKFSDDQLFFLSAARVWCGTGEMDYEYYKMGDAHAPSQARVELSMMNFPAFAQAFKCKVGTKFAPLHTCSLWGDFLQPKIEE